MSSLTDILEISRLVLQRDDLASESNFFDVGGTSLDAIHIVSKIEERFAISLPLFDFSGAPDFRGVAALVDRQVELAHLQSEEGS